MQVLSKSKVIGIPTIENNTSSIPPIKITYDVITSLTSKDCNCYIRYYCLVCNSITTVINHDYIYSRPDKFRIEFKCNCISFIADPYYWRQPDQYLKGLDKLLNRNASTLEYFITSFLANLYLLKVPYTLYTIKDIYNKLKLTYI